MTKPLKPGPGQESVWDYPRPPRLELSSRRIRIVWQGVTIADTTAAFRVLETSHPPTWYLPPADIKSGILHSASGSSFCEFKGKAAYWDIRAGDAVGRQAAWSYANPSPAFAPIRDYLAFYPSRVDACFVDDWQVQPQQGDFYGGWVTPDVVGPFKGGPGSWGW